MINYIQGGIARDHRGQIRFVNDFDMSCIKRFYIIKNADLDILRGWRAHKIEQRWFYVLSGKFLINVIQIDDWSKPSQNLPVEKFTLDSSENKILHLSSGYATAFQSLEPSSELLVFSDYGIENAAKDDYLYSLDYFDNI